MLESGNVVRPVFGKRSIYLDYTGAHFFSDNDELKPIFRSLRRHGVDQISEIVRRSKTEILILSKVAPPLIDQLEEELASIGLGFQMDVVTAR